MSDLLTPEDENTNKKGKNQTSKGKTWILIAVILILLTIIGYFIVIPQLKTYLIKQEISKVMDGVKAGYIEEKDLDISGTIFKKLKEDTVGKKVVKYLGIDEDNWNQFYLDLTKHMTYKVTSVQQVATNDFKISIQIQNTDNKQGIHDSIDTMVKDGLIHNIDTFAKGEMFSEFLDTFEKNRVGEQAQLKKEFDLELIKQEGRWTLKDKNQKNQKEQLVEIAFAVCGMDEDFSFLSSYRND